MSATTFPTYGVDLAQLLVVGDMERSNAPPGDPDTVGHQVTIRVPDCRGAYEVLRSRGTEFLTSPVDRRGEVRRFVRDPAGHVLEISEVG